MRVSEKTLRSVVHRLLLEMRDEDNMERSELSDINANHDNTGPLEGNLVGKKFAFVDGGEPAFEVVADNPAKKIAIVRKYLSNQNRMPDFESDIRNLDGFEQLNAEAHIQLISDAIDQTGGWKSNPDILESILVYSSRRVANYYIINRVLENLKKPILIATTSGQAKVEDFGCVIPYEKAANYVAKSDPKSSEFALGAACFYEYANSPKYALLAGALGALIGGAIGLFFGGVGAGPGAFTGATLAGGGTDLYLRYPVMRWAAANEKYGFLAANCLLVAINFIPAIGELKFVKGAAIKIAPKLMAMLSPTTKLKIAKVVTELCIQILPDVALQFNKIEKEVLSLLDDPEKIDETLSASDAAMTAYLKEKYPSDF
jgi:hypothetical protein